MEIFIRRFVIAEDEHDNILRTKNGITCGCSYPDIELRDIAIKSIASRTYTAVAAASTRSA